MSHLGLPSQPDVAPQSRGLAAWHYRYGILRHTMWYCAGLPTVFGMCRQEGSSVELDKDSSLCLACLDTVVIDNQDAAPLYAEV